MSEELKPRLCERPLLKYDAESASGLIRHARKIGNSILLSRAVTNLGLRRPLDVFGSATDVELTKAFRESKQGESEL